MTEHARMAAMEYTRVEATEHTRVEVTEHTWVEMTTYQSGSDRASQNENDTQAVTQLHFLLFHRKYAAIKCYSLLFHFFHREQKACLAYFSAQPSAENILVKTLLMYDPPQPLHHENILVKTLLMYDPPQPLHHENILVKTLLMYNPPH